MGGLEIVLQKLEYEKRWDMVLGIQSAFYDVPYFNIDNNSVIRSIKHIGFQHLMEIKFTESVEISDLQFEAACNI